MHYSTVHDPFFYRPNPNDAFYIKPKPDQTENIKKWNHTGPNCFIFNELEKTKTGPIFKNTSEAGWDRIDISNFPTVKPGSD